MNIVIFDKIENLSVDAKIVYLLSLSELIIHRISNSEGYEVAVEALEKCWEWVRYKNVEASELYHYLENMDEIDVMTYLQFAFLGRVVKSMLKKSNVNSR